MSRVGLLDKLRAKLFQPKWQLDSDGERGCEVFCDCNPHVSICGVWLDVKNSPKWSEVEHGDCAECRLCAKILEKTGCPNCGCRGDEECHKCLTSRV